jgi:ubiquinone/menaquinone biosynthesis C-methylase UbiE
MIDVVNGGQRGDRWTSMESANDPDWFVRFLDRTSTRPGERHPAVALLELDPGQRCLDVGCGIGEDARAIAELGGARVVGVDVNTRMVRESRSRSAGLEGLSFLVAEGGQLPFAGASFDAAWVKRTLMHLADPGSVVAEMARVVRPGGRVVAVEPDSEVVLLDSGLVEVTRRLLAYRATGYACPWAGRQLRRLMLQAGLTDVRATVDSTAFTDLAEAEARLRLISTASAAARRGILTAAEVSQWEEDLRDRDASGVFACYLLTFTARGRRPE